MPIELKGHDRAFELTPADWARVLELAHQYGWKHTGPEPPDSSEIAPTCGVSYDPLKSWDGDDYGLSGYTITEDDANNLAAALDKALNNISPDNTITRVNGQKVSEFGVNTTSQFRYFRGPNSNFLVAESRSYQVQAGAALEDYFSGDMRDCITSIVAFCRGGSFIIAVPPQAQEPLN